MSTKNKSKRQTLSRSYRKTLITAKDEIILLIENNPDKDIELLQQQFYNDGSRSVTVKIHFNPSFSIKQPLIKSKT